MSEVNFPFEGKLKPAQLGNHIADSVDVELDSTSLTGVLAGAGNAQTALGRFDATGVGAAIFTFTGSYSATAANISEWFGGKQLVRMRCTDSGIGTGSTGTVTFDLPGSTALGTAFDQLVAAGLPEVLRFVIEYTGATKDRMSIRPRVSPAPQIGGATNILVRSGIAAQLEITRSSGTISNYVFQSIGLVSAGGDTVDSIKLQNPANAIWDASDTASLPTDTQKGFAYKVFNVPASGEVLGEVMQNGDWVVWEGSSFTSWTATPHQWFVLSAHDVRRITALEQNFLTDVQVTPVSDRNSVVRGAVYADTVGEIRLKIYSAQSDYDAADLNTTGDVDEYTDATDQTGYLAIRLSGTLATLQSSLPSLYVYSEDSGTFEKLLNMDRDFTHQGNFGSESDYLSDRAIEYTAGTVLRIYVGADVDRYTLPNIDVFEGNLSDSLLSMITAQAPWASVAGVLFSGATVKDIHVADRVEYESGYSRGIDWRDMSQSITINENRYADGALSVSVNLAAFTVTGFGNTIRKIIGIKLQRNDAQTGEGAMVEMGLGSALIRVNTSNEIQVNTAVGSGAPVWASLNDENGNITIASGSSNFLIFEMNPVTGSAAGAWELVADFFDGTNYHECNNMTFTPTGDATGDNLGFSRSANQRGQVTQFRAINSPGYLTHNTLDQLLRQHQDDKWDFGFARLFEGSDAKEVVLKVGVVFDKLLLESPDGTQFTVAVANDGTLSASS